MSLIKSVNCVGLMVKGFSECYSICRDIVDRSTLAHFRAHTSPLLLLQFDASGTLLVTASVHGHTVNIYHLAAPSKRGEVGSAVHLFRLCRGMTPAVIQGVAFSRSGQWLCVSSARVGTTYLPFPLSSCSAYISEKLFWDC